MDKTYKFFALGFVLLCNLFLFVNADEVKVQKDGIISQSTYKIDAIYPSNIANPLAILFPGARGTNQLVIYKRDYARHTGTNEFGREAVVRNNIVSQITGANSTIPADGYVISGHGVAKKWISDNIKVGTHVKIDESNLLMTVFTDVQSYRYYADEKIKEVEKIVRSSASKANNDNYKIVKKYLKSAKKYYRRAKKDSTRGLINAKKSIDCSNMALIQALPYKENELKGVWLRPVEKNRAEIERTLDALHEAGINTVFLETYFHGKTIFPSNTMRKYGFINQNPDFKDFDYLAVWIEEAQKRKIKTHTWFESFYIGNKAIIKGDKTILDVKPQWSNLNKANADSTTPIYHDLEHKGYFLDPANAEVTCFLQELVAEIAARYDIDGINLDYVRYPLSAKPETLNYTNSNWGYTPIAREEFKLKFGIDPLDVRYGTQFWRDWNKYRQEKITNYIAELSKTLKNRNITLSAVVFPQEENSLETKQQDWDTWVQNCYLDALTPLILTADYELSSDMLKNIKKKTGSKAQVYPGLFVTFMQGEPEDLLKQLHVIRAEKFEGVVLFDWAHFDDKYKNLLKASMFKVEE